MPQKNSWFEEEPSQNDWFEAPKNVPKINLNHTYPDESMAPWNLSEPLKENPAAPTYKPPSQTSLVGDLYNRVFEAPKFITDYARKISDYITDPNSTPNLNKAYPKLTPYVKGFLGGGIKGAASQITPANAIMGAEASDIIPATRLLQYPVKALGGLQAIRGASKVKEGDLSGLVDVGLGGLGMLGGKSGNKDAELGNFVEEQLAKAREPKLPIDVAQPELPLEPQLSAKDKLLKAVEESKPLTKEQRLIYKNEKSQRLAELKNVTTGGQAGFNEKLSKLGGEYEKVTQEPLKLEQNDVDELFNTIAQHPRSIGFNEIHAGTGLTRLLNGEVPRDYELKQLEAVFGPQMKQIQAGRGVSLITEAVNLPRTLMASMDLSAPFRQGATMLHKKEYWSAFNDMFRSALSEKAYDAVVKNIESHPHFTTAIDNGLALTDTGHIMNREEQFLSSWARAIPGVKGSERAYSAFLNKLRMDTYGNLIDKAKGMGIDIEKNPVFAKSLAQYVNSATGRGSLGKLEQNAVLLNNTLFSPRLIASRLQMLNPQNYLRIGEGMGPEANMLRKEYLKSALSLAAFGTGMVELGKVIGGKVSNDPHSSDFRKLQIGNTRLDPYGGFQQYITALNRLGGYTVDAVTGQDMSGYGAYKERTGETTLKDFARSKVNPAIGFAWSMLDNRKELGGQPMKFDTLNPFDNAVAQRFIPLVVQDLYSLQQTNPELFATPLPELAAFGMGLQPYRKVR